MVKCNCNWVHPANEQHNGHAYMCDISIAQREAFNGIVELSFTKVELQILNARIELYLLQAED